MPTFRRTAGVAGALAGLLLIGAAASAGTRVLTAPTAPTAPTAERQSTRAAPTTPPPVVVPTPYPLPSPPCNQPILPCPTPTPSHRPNTDKYRVYRGLGTWVDAYDFSREFNGRLTVNTVDEMARQGVRTLYLQAAKDDPKVPGNLLSPDRLGQWLERAHAKKINVVAWYLPRFTNPEKDWRHLDAILKFRSPNNHRFDAIGVDIEARDVKDHRVRSDRLVALSRRLRAATTLTVSAIVVPPVVLDEINRNFWPDFPWLRLKSSYDVWAPMAYYTYRTQQSGWRDAYTYITANIDYLRRDLEDPNARVHVIGGVGDKSSPADYDGLVRGARDRSAIGASSYDYATTHGSAWATLRKSPS